MKKLSFVMVALMVLSLSAGASEWVPLKMTRGPQAPAESSLTVEKTRGGVEVKVDLPGFYRATRSVNSVDFALLDLPGASKMMVKDAPELPKLTTFIPVPHGATISGIDVNEGAPVAVDFDQDIVPSRGHLPRSINPETVPVVRGEAYNQAWPQNLVEVEDAFQFGALQGVRVQITPFQYDGQNRSLQAYPELRFTVNYEGGRDGSFLGEGPKTAEFIELYKNMFSGSLRDAIEAEVRDIPVEAGKMLIICYDDFADAMQPFVEWKKKSGIQVKMVLKSEVGSTANDIKAYVQNEYDAGNLTHLMLVGDVQQIPFLRGKFERAPSDACYVKLAGNDNIPDAFHCRISAQNVEDVQTQINKFMFYEMYPPQGADAAWLMKHTGIASSEGNPTDYTRMNWLRDELLKFNYTSHDEIYDPGASASRVSAVVNEGRGMIDYIGHGSNTSWGTTRFSVSDVNRLNNTNKLPMIWSVACVNGKYDYYSDCFAEAWIKAGTPDEAKGAVGILASTTNEAWVPPCDMQKEIVNVQICGEKTFSLGALTMAGMLKAFEIWGSSDSSRGNQLNEQNVLFSDSTLLLRNAIPKPARATASVSGNKVSFNVSTMTKYVRVSMYNEDLSKVVSGIAKNGKVTLTVPAGLNARDMQYTVYGKDLIPLIDQDI